MSLLKPVYTLIELTLQTVFMCRILSHEWLHSQVKSLFLPWAHSLLVLNYSRKLHEILQTNSDLHIVKTASPHIFVFSSVMNRFERIFKSNYVVLLALNSKIASNEQVVYDKQFERNLSANFWECRTMIWMFILREFQILCECKLILTSLSLLWWILTSQQQTISTKINWSTERL